VNESLNQNERVLVLMPCHNEKGRIGDVIRSVKKTLPHAHVAVINDDSSDGSGDEAEQAGAAVLSHGSKGRIGDVIRSVKKTLPHAHVAVINDDSSDGSGDEAEQAGAAVLSHGSTLGYGVALETGYLYAVKADYDIVLQMDSDGQHLADELPLLLDPIRDGTADLVIGSRYHGTTPTPATSIIRKAGHRIFSAMIFVLTGLKLSDPTSGFQGLSKRTLSLFSSGVFPCDYPDSDVIIMAHMSGLRIREVPCRMRDRLGGRSMHSGLKPVYYGMKMLLAMFMVLLNFHQWHKWREKLS
jgi:glycosyltransferase involved in cell wall biosynthesis